MESLSVEEFAMAPVTDLIPGPLLFAQGRLSQTGFPIATLKGWQPDRPFASAFAILPGLLLTILARSLFLSPSHPHANTYGPNPQEVTK